MPISAAVLKELKRGRLFIETGCDRGEGIAAALEAGFTKVISVELDLLHTLQARQRFRGRPVTVLCGDTVKVLPSILAELNETATFWLDAHSATWSPVLEELAIIEKHLIKDHTLLIDDRRMMQSPTIPGSFLAPMEPEVRKAILQVNAAYKISLADGYIPNDIIVAQILE